MNKAQIIRNPGLRSTCRVSVNTKKIPNPIPDVLKMHLKMMEVCVGM